MPKVSILIPATRPTFLPQAIASALAQTFADIEILVGDDSPDGALEPVVARFSDPRLRYLRSEGRSQQSNAVFLWNNSGGEYLHYLHDDDLILPFLVGDLSAILDEHGAATFAFGNSVVVGADGRRLAHFRPVAIGTQPVMGPGVMAKELLPRIQNVIGGTHTVLMARDRLPGPECLTHYEGFPLRALFDLAFFINANAQAPCVGTGVEQGVYRRHEDQVSAKEANPAYFAAIYEWEILIRGEIARGALTREQSLKALYRLEATYRQHTDFDGIQPFIDGMPKLVEQVTAGETDVLDAIRPVWEQADALAAQRLAERTAARGLQGERMVSPLGLEPRTL